jgi:hypothetical protein
MCKKALLFVPRVGILITLGVSCLFLRKVDRKALSLKVAAVNHEIQRELERTGGKLNHRIEQLGWERYVYQTRLQEA